MTDKQSASEIEFIRAIVEKTSQRIDCQAFHFVHWGLIVMLWYPLGNYVMEMKEVAIDTRLAWYIGIGVGSSILGITLSAVRGARAAGRLVGENTFIGKQVVIVTSGCIGAGMILSAVAPSAGWIHGRDVPILWGLIYANLTFMMGVIYNREFVIAGLCIFAGSIVAMFMHDIQGYILGPVMGLGMIIPGRRAEARVRGVMLAAGKATAEVRA